MNKLICDPQHNRGRAPIKKSCNQKFNILKKSSRKKNQHNNPPHHSMKEVVTKLKKKGLKKISIKRYNTINLILTLNYYAGQTKE